jgi:glucose/arabinose dehydrogenase
MNPNNERMEPPDLSHYEENRSKFPLEELAKYWGKHVAFSPDGTRILASGDTGEALDAALDAAGIPCNQVVYAYVELPDVSYI